MDDELKRIEDEIRKAKEKRQALEDRKNRRLKQIRARQERDKVAWLKKMSTVLDKTLSEMKGRTYFYEFTQEQVAEQIGISRQHMGAIEAPNMVRAISLDVLFNIATVLEIEPYVLLKFSPDK